MRFYRFGLVSFCLALSMGTPSASAFTASPEGTNPGQNVRSSVMRVYGPTDPPYAFWRFCDEFAADCVKRDMVDHRYAPKGGVQELDDINSYVNRTIEPVTDLELYGVSDYWTLPQEGKGDCEDYALLKRHLLIRAGWPSSALLVTVVRDEKGEGHAVLTARTSTGDYILDNKVDVIKLWHDTPYRFVMRQSFLDPKAWVALDPAQSAPPVSIAVANRSKQ